jgi:hypothetical protein
MRPIRLLVTLSIFVVGSLASASAASAAITQSQVTAPADQTYLIEDRDSPAPIMVTGTSDGTTGDSVDIRCYYGVTSFVVATGVAVNPGGTFSKSVALSTFTASPGTYPHPSCVLRAVVGGTTPAAPPGSASPFGGPHVYVGARQSNLVTSGPNNGVAYDYYITRAQQGGFMDYDSLGGCGLDDSYVFDPTTGASSSALFYCNDWFYIRNGAPTASAGKTASTRSELRVDGVDAYASAGAYYVPKSFSPSYGGVPGIPPLTQTDSVDPLTGNLKITEAEAIVKCSPAPTYPPTAASCTSFVPTGVTFERTIIQDHLGRMTTIRDRWSSADGLEHLLDMQVAQQQHGALKDTGYQFPWVSADFATRAAGDTIPAAPAGPGSIFIRGSNAAPDGDTTHPRGAITFAAGPEGGQFAQGQAASSTMWDWFELNYRRTIPANGSIAMGFAYSNAFAQVEVQSMASSAEAAFKPTVQITAPADAYSSSQAQATVSGTARDAGGPVTLKVGGLDTAVAADGSWSQTVPLQAGQNTITASATNVYGNAVQQQVTVSYSPPAPPSTPPPPASPPTVKLSGSPSLAGNVVGFSLNCTSLSGAPCTGTAKLTATKLVRGRTVVGVTTKKQPKKTRVLVGTKKFSVPAGKTQRIKVPLNAAGKKLLTRFRKLPVTLTVFRNQPTGAPKAAFTKKLTFKQKVKKRAH